jgi:hypothetical protein
MIECVTQNSPRFKSWAIEVSTLCYFFIFTYNFASARNVSFTLSVSLKKTATSGNRLNFMSNYITTSILAIIFFTIKYDIINFADIFIWALFAGWLIFAAFHIYQLFKPAKLSKTKKLDKRFFLGTSILLLIYNLYIVFILIAANNKPIEIYSTNSFQVQKVGGKWENFVYCKYDFDRVERSIKYLNSKEIKQAENSTSLILHYKSSILGKKIQVGYSFQ